MRIDAFVTVWGAPYVEKYLTYSLASELSAGNIPAIARDGVELFYHIYTDRASRPLFEPALGALARHAEVRFVYYEDMAFKGASLAEAIANSPPEIVKHNVQRLTSLDFLAHAGAHGTDGALLLDSDFIFSEGSWPALIAARRDGARAVCGMFLRLNEDVAAARLADRMAAGMAPRDLVALGLDAMHPSLAAMFVDADPFSAYPSQLNWHVGQNGRAGFVTHCYFPHPLLTVPGAGARYTGTMDYEYALRIEPDDARVHLFGSSDDFLVCKMSPSKYGARAARGGSAKLADLARFALLNTNLRHRLFMAQPIRFVADDAAADWDSVEGASTRFVAALYEAVELLVAGAGQDARALMQLKSFLGPIEDFASPQTAARLKNWL